MKYPNIPTTIRTTSAAPEPHIELCYWCGKATRDWHRAASDDGLIFLCRECHQEVWEFCEEDQHAKAM